MNNRSKEGRALGDSEFVFLLARQRSGTNALRSVLTTHPDVFCFPEIFNSRPTPTYQLEMNTNFFGYLERLPEDRYRSFLASEDRTQVFLEFLEYLRCFSSKRFLLIDVKYSSSHHLNPAWHSITQEPILFSFLKEKGYRVLILKRWNWLRYYLSEAKAQLSQKWHAFDEAIVGSESWFGEERRRANQISDSAITVDIEDMLNKLRLCRSEDEVVATSFGGYGKCLTIEYEELFEHIGAPVSQTALDKISSWIGVDDRFTLKRPEFRKMADLPLHETIANYDEVATALRDSGFEDLLKDEALHHG